jgi:RAS protein activator-like 2
LYFFYIDRYFCEVSLDRTLYSRTSSKTKSEMCFWGEQFEFSNLPNVSSIAVSLYREGDAKKRKEKKTLVGQYSWYSLSISTNRV